MARLHPVFAFLVTSAAGSTLGATAPTGPSASTHHRGASAAQMIAAEIAALA
jgi:hypothetical protein